MQRVKHNPLNLAIAHFALISYTIIALFPVIVIIVNSFKTRKAIFGDPLALPNRDTFSLVGYETVLKHSDFDESIAAMAMPIGFCTAI